jgi:hypothetical protein
LILFVAILGRFAKMPIEINAPAKSGGLGAGGSNPLAPTNILMT